MSWAPALALAPGPELVFTSLVPQLFLPALVLSFVCLAFVLQLKFVIVTVFTYIDLASIYMYLLFKYTLFFYIRTSKFCLRLAVVNFFIFETEMLICSYFPDWNLQCHKEECQTKYYKNTLFHFFHSFFQEAHIGSHLEVFYKKAVLQLC